MSKRAKRIKQGVFRLTKSSDPEINDIAIGFNGLPTNIQHLIWSFFCNHYKEVSLVTEDWVEKYYSEGMLYDGKREGMWLSETEGLYYTSTNAMYHLGVRHGSYLFTRPEDENRKLSKSGGQYKNGVMYGVWRRWWPNGQTSQLTKFDASGSVVTGSQLFWSEEGEEITEEEFGHM